MTDLALTVLKEKLAHPDALLLEIGEIVAEDCRAAFEKQRLGDIAWPERYPRQRGPTINIAGALQDFIDGAREPKANRFQNRPALIDSGDLSQSIHARLSGAHAVTIYTDDPHAYTQHHGLETEQSYGGEVRRRISDWLDGKPEYRQSMERLLHKSVHRTKVNMRPIIGITDEARERIMREVKTYFEGRHGRR